MSVEVLHSIERPNYSATFGTSTPPAGLSGVIRRRAFDYSENSYAHWLPLMLANRIGVVEGVLEDFAHGHVPNIFGEMGWKAEWQQKKFGDSDSYRSGSHFRRRCLPAQQKG